MDESKCRHTLFFYLHADCRHSIILDVLSVTCSTARPLIHENRYFKIMPNEILEHEFLSPWNATGGGNGSWERGWLNRLQSQIGLDHALYGLPLRIVGNYRGATALLFEVLDGTGRLAVIGVDKEKGDYSFSLPDTLMYPDFDAFKTQRMIADHADYVASIPGHKVLIKAAKEGNLELIRQQVEKGVNIDSIDFPTGTALCAAAENNQIEAAKVLIELGADLEKTDNSPMPMTALFKAVSNEHYEMASLLLAHGADPNAMFLTWSSTPRNCLEFLKSCKLENTSLYKLLLKHGAEFPTYIKMVEKYPAKAAYIAKAIVSAEHFDDAIELTTYLIEKKPDSTLHYQRGVAHDMTNNPVAALSDFDAAIALDSANYQAFYSRALVKRKLGRLQESVVDLEVAVKLNPSDSISLNALASELLRTDREATRDPERSVNLANAACELSDWSDTICIATLAEAYRQTGNISKALEMDQKVAELREREELL